MLTGPVSAGSVAVTTRERKAPSVRLLPWHRGLYTETERQLILAAAAEDERDEYHRAIERLTADHPGGRAAPDTDRQRSRP